MGANAVCVGGWGDTADHHDFFDKAYNGRVEPVYVIAGFGINPGRDIDPASPANEREEIKEELRQMVAVHKNHPAILMWAVGNELNAGGMYGAHPDHLFSLINEMAQIAHDEEGTQHHPVTTALFDADLKNTIATNEAAVPALDVCGANVYRGKSFGGLFTEYAAVSAKPLIILGYGIDAYDSVHGHEYEQLGTPYQAQYAATLWNEITKNPLLRLMPTGIRCIQTALMRPGNDSL